MIDSHEVWKCLNCAEDVEEQFDVCWNCEATRAGRLPAVRTPRDNEADPKEKAFLNEKFRSKYCVRCGVGLDYAGKRTFHDGARLGALGDLAELLVNKTNLEMYICPKCFHVEFFLSDPNY